MPEDTLVKMFQNRVRKYGERVALRRKRNNRWEELSWKEFGEQVKNFSLGLIVLGLQKGETVSILSENRPEWVFADLGIMSAGGIGVSIYAGNLPQDVAYIIAHSESKIVVVENQEQLSKVIAVRGELPYLEKIVVIEDFERRDDLMIMSFSDVGKLGFEQGCKDEKMFEKRLLEVKPEDTAAIVYTSGTTGPPKGVMLSQANFIFICSSTLKIFAVSDQDISLSFLPLAHALERVVFFMTIYAGATVSFAESIKKIGENILEVRPTILIGVPRIFEKIYEGVISRAESTSRVQKVIFNWCVRGGKMVCDLRLSNKKIPLLLRLKYRIADRLIFSKLRDRLGGRIKIMGSGGAPLAKEIIEFFLAAGLPILEAYGMTETTAPSMITRLENMRPGYVGQAIPGVKIKIAEDGEILIKGGNLFKGYFKNPQATAEALKDGWLHSGDIGEIDREGFLKVTDRKKDIIITAGGKNVAPQNIENNLKVGKYISQVMVYGDRRPYLTALITLNEEEVVRFAQANKIRFANFAQLSQHSVIKQLVIDIVREKNEGLARFERIKRFVILPEDFSYQSGELTPTIKVKRKFTQEKFAKIIEGMYSSGPPVGVVEVEPK